MAAAAHPRTRSADAAPVPQRLLTTASRLFAERGFDGTSVQEIVDAVGVTKGALYHYFGSKDDLLVEIYHRVLALQTERLEAVAGGDGPVGERLREAAADVVVTSIENADDARVFFRSMHLLAPAKQAEVRAERRVYHERFRGMIEDGQRLGTFRADVSADIAAHNFFGGVHHLHSWYQRDGAMTPREIGEAFADLLLHGLRA